MSNKSIVVSHIFDASPKELWDAWTDPKQFAKWFNPFNNDELIIHEFDVRIGGRFSFDIPQPNGEIRTENRIFHVLEPFKEIISKSQDNLSSLRTTFETQGKKTKMVIEITGLPLEYYAGASKIWKRSFRKLELIKFSQIIL